METKQLNMVVRSVLVGIVVTIIYLAIGLLLDYIITQLLSQFVLSNCSEDCYFRYFNIIFAVMAVFSLMGGIRSGMRSYKRLAENK